jgi:hypothetical protein
MLLSTMGFFGTYLFENGAWRSGTVLPGHDELWQPLRGDEPPAAAEPCLLVDIHDSDITTLTYRPPGPGTGLAYLGITPRSYFAREDASAPTDVGREAAGLAFWWQRVHGASADEAARKESEIAAFLAHDLGPGEADEDDEDYDDEDADDGDLDDPEIFVEIKTSHFLAALGLPIPSDLQR